MSSSFVDFKAGQSEDMTDYLTTVRSEAHELALKIPRGADGKLDKNYVEPEVIEVLRKSFKAKKLLDAQGELKTTLDDERVSGVDGVKCSACLPARPPALHARAAARRAPPRRQLCTVFLLF